MKLRIVIAVLLVIVIAELGWLTFALERDYSAAVVQDQYEMNQLHQREQEVAQLQAELDGMEDTACGEIDVETQRLREEIAMLDGQKEDISAEIESLSKQLEELKAQLDAMQEENEYYLEVYNELKEGLEKVKGYIADS